MPRHALRSFFERVVIASLPLIVPACGGSKGTTVNANDMAVPIETSDMAEGAGGNDLTGGGGGGGGGGDTDLAVAGDMACVDDIDMYPLTGVYVPNDIAPPTGHWPEGTLCRTSQYPCDPYCPTGYNTCCGPNASDMNGYSQMACQRTCGPSGRRPEGLADVVVDGGCGIGHFFATQAHLEAASVHAFRTLARELAAHGAPDSLVAAARRSLREEVRHARATRAMALAHGARPSPVRVTPSTTRSLEAIAVENAAEGCVRETYGALLANWQARAAGDPAVRALMADIADDETRHAELAWAVDAWARTRLSSEARARVRDARRAAAAELADEVAAPPDPALVERLGLPDAARARAFVAAATRELWT